MGQDEKERRSATEKAWSQRNGKEERYTEYIWQKTKKKNKDNNKEKETQQLLKVLQEERKDEKKCVKKILKQRKLEEEKYTK